MFASGSRTTRLDALWVFLLALAVLALLLPQRTYGDDLFFTHCVVHDWPFARHFLYMPIARPWAGLLALVGVDPLLALRLLAATGTAVGCALFFAAARGLGVGRGPAWLFALLILGAPSIVFFGTAAEIHGVHLAAVGLCAWTLSRLDAGVSARAVLLAGLAFGAVCGTHKSGGLLIPALLTAYVMQTRGRTRDARLRDACMLGLAAAVTLGAMFASTAAETGDALGARESVGKLTEAFRARVTRGYGVDDFFAFVSGDGVLPAAFLTLGGAVALVVLLRQGQRSAWLALSVLLPYHLFFPVWNYPERGAFYVITLPVWAILIVLWSARASRAARLSSFLFVLAAALGVFTLDETVARLGPWTPALVLAGCAACGLLRLSAPSLALVAVLAVLQACGAVRNVRAYDRTRPVLDWVTGAAQATEGDETVVLLADFPRNWALVLLSQPWPEPYAGTWAFAEELPRPVPSAHVYGDPGLPSPAFRQALFELDARGTRILVDESVRAFLLQEPRHAADLEFIEARFELDPVEYAGFRAERLRLP